MSFHLHLAVLTGEGVFSNQHGEIDSEGGGGENLRPLQKVLMNGIEHTMMSAYAIRYALRESLRSQGFLINRPENPEEKSPTHDPNKFADDDVLGFMSTSKGNSATARTSRLGVGTVTSLSPFTGDSSQHFASPLANGKGKHPVPFQREIHGTRFQYIAGLTPGLESDALSRIIGVINGIRDLSRPGGSHSSCLYEFSPEIIVFQWTHSPVGRMNRCFGMEGKNVVLDKLLYKLEVGDIDPKETVLGSSFQLFQSERIEKLGLKIRSVKGACEEIISRIKRDLK